MFGAYGWTPFSLTAACPLPLLHPVPLDLPQPLVLTPEEAAVLAVGQGRVDMDLKWMWRWGGDGVLRVFRSWTGFEAYRLHLVPQELAPGATAWRARLVEVDADPRRVLPEEAVRELPDLLRSLAASPAHVSGYPADRAAALRAALPDGEPVAPVARLAESLARLLPVRVVRLRIVDRLVQVPAGLVLQEAVVSGDAVELRFSDGARLWLEQTWKAAVDRERAGGRVGGVLLWPGPRWPSALAGLGAWSARWQPSRGMHETGRDAVAQEVGHDVLGVHDVPFDDALWELGFAPDTSDVVVEPGP